MNELALIDTSSLPNVSTAKLPVVYESAKTALSTCERVDECKEWADKAEAIASYARQSQDETLLNTAMRIKDRAIRRCGELLREIEAAKNQHSARAAADTGTPTRNSAAKDAGLSNRQKHQALRVANVPVDEFEEMVEASPPATVTKLAERGKKPSTAHLKGRDPKDFTQSTKGMGAVEGFLERVGGLDAAAIVRGLLPFQRKQMKVDVRNAIAWLKKLQGALKKGK